MIKSLKWQFIISLLTAVLFVISSFYYIDLRVDEKVNYPRVFFYAAMIFSVFNAGLLTQKFISHNK